MPKPSKSSASAGTRKKNAKKAAKPGGDGEVPDGTGGAAPQQRKQRGQKKLSKAQQRALPKIKQYVPPPKPPAPLIPDPLDGQGLARTLPAELVVVLRRLGKKDDVTRRKGLEDLREGWVTPVAAATRKGDTSGDAEVDLEGELRETALLSAVPVWLHNLASMLQSPFHRSLALQVHSELLSIPTIRSSILESLSLSLLPGTQNRDVLGSWMVSALEEGRRGGGASLRYWEQSTVMLDAADDLAGDGGEVNLTAQTSSLVEYISLSILDPPSLHDDIHPAPVASTSGSSTPVKPTGKAGKLKAPPPALLSATPPPASSAEDDEVVEERWARYRVGGLVALAWMIQQLSQKGRQLPSELAQLLRNPLLWTSLASSATQEEGDSGPLGAKQPPVRRAGYSLLLVLVTTYPDQLADNEMLDLIALAVLNNCWTETEATVWETAGPAVAKFLSKFPHSWAIAQAHSHIGSSSEIKLSAEADGETGSDEGENESEADVNDDDGDDADSEDDDQELEAGQTNTSDSAVQLPSSPVTASVFASFLNFIATICPTLPHLTYPILLVVISTLPPTVLPLEPIVTPEVQNLFFHLWSPADARLLSTHSLPGQVSAFQAFLQTAMDITPWLIGKAWPLDSGNETAFWLAKEQLGSRIWKEGVLDMGGKAGRRGAQASSTEFEAQSFGSALERTALVSPDLVPPVLAAMGTDLVHASFPTSISAEDGKSVPVLSRSLAIIRAVGKESRNEITVPGLDQMVVDLTAKAIDRFGSGSDNTTRANAEAGFLIDVLAKHADIIPAEQTSRLAKTLSESFEVLTSQYTPSALVTLSIAVGKRIAETAREEVRQSALRSITSTNITKERSYELAQEFVNSGLESFARDGAIDNIAIEASQAALGGIGNSLALNLARSSMKSQSILSADAINTILALVSTSIHDSVHQILVAGEDADPSLSAAIDILTAYSKHGLSHIVQSDIYVQALIAIHHLAILVLRISRSAMKNPVARGLWNQCAELGAEERSRVLQLVFQSLANVLEDSTFDVDPSILVDAALVTGLGDIASPKPSAAVSLLIPDIQSLLQGLGIHAAKTPNSTLPIVDALVPCSSEDGAFTSSVDVGNSSTSSIARQSEALLSIIRVDRSLGSQNPQALQLILQIAIFAQDALSVPGSSRGVYAASVSRSHLHEVIQEAEVALSYALSAVDEVPPSWHKDTVQILRSGTAPATADFLQTLLRSLASDSRNDGNDVAARVFRDTLGRHLRQSGGGSTEAEVWLNYAMVQSETAPQLALAIMLAIKPFLLDTKPFEVAQNRLANALTTIPAKFAGRKGIPALRLLLATAPPPDAASVFLPQQRAVFVLRHISSWITSDEADDLPDDLEYRLAEIYTALVPIVQDLSGAHWDSFFDLIESGLETSTLDDQSTFCLLYQCLLLLQEIRDLSQSNKALRALWVNKDKHMALVLQLFLQCRNAETAPLQLIQSLLLDLLADVPDKVMATAGLPELAELLRLSNSASIQCAAYRIMSRVIRENTSALVFELEATIAEVEERGTPKQITLPEALMTIVKAGIALDWHSDIPIHTILGQLLSWMAILDHFDDASRTLRWAYLDQLKSTKLFEDGLLPMLFAMLGVSELGAWNFPANQYAVDEFYPDLLDPEDLPDLAPLASHLYYRALVTIPSAMRTYYESLKDRQLSMSMLTFTARHYSPVIIAHEFSAIRAPAAMAQLTEEGLNVRVAQGGGATVAGTGAAEAIASYVVDEQPMEIGIRLPAEFPLKGVDVRDLRRVGVPENKWRGWLMSVQQTITSRNGLILEALTVFKKNVSLHFEGVVECAICYSIISLTDRTLPTKPCRTCKNRFHASCLFKWFNSSHSSSCPLCRSLF